MRAKVVPERIERSSACGRTPSEGPESWRRSADHGIRARLFERAHIVPDRDRADRRPRRPEVRPPLSVSGVEAIQGLGQAFFPQATPTWGPFSRGGVSALAMWTSRLP